MTHVKHLGFELEAKVIMITRALAELSPVQRLVIIDHLAPVGLKRAVADQFDIDLSS